MIFEVSSNPNHSMIKCCCTALPMPCLQSAMGLILPQALCCWAGPWMGQNRGTTQSLLWLEKTSENPTSTPAHPTMPTAHIPQCHIPVLPNTSRNGDPSTPCIAVPLHHCSFGEEIFPNIQPLWLFVHAGTLAVYMQRNPALQGCVLPSVPLPHLTCSQQRSAIGCPQLYIALCWSCIIPSVWSNPEKV